jgi:transcriptional regulator with XRE-family HTH domain
MADEFNLNTMTSRIESLAREKRIPLKELAESANMHYKMLWRAFKGERNIKPEELLAIANKLDTSTGYLLGQTDDPERHTSLLSIGMEGETGNYVPPTDAARRGFARYMKSVESKGALNSSLPAETNNPTREVISDLDEDIHAPPAKKGDPTDDVTNAIVVIRNIVRDKQEIPDSDREILLKIMKYGVKALEDDPEAIEYTGD